jgi:hypothetical protein
VLPQPARAKWTLAPHGIGFEKICVYRTPLIAWAVYRWQSLQRVAGEDRPNFEPGSDAPTVPTKASSLENLHADEWEIGAESATLTAYAEAGLTRF